MKWTKAREQRAVELPFLDGVVYKGIYGEVAFEQKPD